jgi:hypothetical protein
VDTPTRKTRRRPDLNIVTTARTFADRAAEIELGWLELREHMHHAGWPSQTPEDDRRARVREDGTIRPPDQECYDGDYADPTGEQAIASMERWHNDLIALQDSRHAIEHHVKLLVAITRRYMPPVDMPELIPLCSLGACDMPVERRVSNVDGAVSYVGMERIAGQWVGKVGVRPQCAKHRQAERRERAA